MPPRLDLLTKRWSTFDLPILQCLAPRVFTPWPRSLRSSHSWSTATANSERARYFWEDGDDLPQTIYDVAQKASSQGGKTDSKIGQGHGLRLSKTVQRETRESPRRRVEFRGRSEELSGAPGDQEDFWTKYEEIWGGLMKKRPPESPVTLVRKVNGTFQEPHPRHKISYIPTISRRERERERKQREEWFTKPKLDRIRRQWELWIGRKRSIRRFKTQNQVRGLAKVRLKYVRVMPEGEFGNFRYSSWWNWCFAMLNARHDETMKGRIKPRMASRKRCRLSEPFTKELVEGKSAVAIRERWAEIPVNQRARMWPEIMLAVLADYPSQALEFLEATFMPPYPPGYAISDSLDFIICHYNENRDSYGAEFLVALSKAIRSFLEEGPANHVHLSQRTLFRLLHMICLDTRELRWKSGALLKLQRKGWIAKNIYRSLVKVDHPMHENTLIQYASGLAKQGDVKTASRILQRLRAEGSAFNSPKMLSLCTTLLQRANQKVLLKGDGGPSITAFDIFRFVLEAGAESNIITYNILMKTSLDAGDHKTGWKIFETMTENGLTADAYTYSILLKDAKSRMDAAAIRAVMDYVRQNNIRSDWIITDVLHAILLLHQQERQSFKACGGPVEQEQTAFDRLLQVYCDHFHVGPLAQIIPNFLDKYPGLSQVINGSQEQLRDPPGPTLVVMITGYLDNADTPYLAMQFYEHFRRLITRNDPVVAPLTKTTHVWNLVLMGIGKFAELLAECSNLVGDMLSGPDQTSTPSRSSVTHGYAEKDSGHTISTDSQLPLRPETAAHESLNPGESVQAEPQPQPPLEPEDVVPEPLDAKNRNPDSISDSSFEPNTETATSKPVTITPPKPDVHTWSILLKIFMDHRQPRAAEKVLSMMSERQITPSQVTWNKLAMGYARMQDTAMTVDVLRRLEVAGLSADEFTMSALGLIKNRRALIDAMKRTESRLVGLDRQFLDDFREDLEKVVSEKEEDKPEPDGGLGKVWGGEVSEEEEEEWW
ncbi:hypothetical protein BKA64DRAFT_652010 [Cadophora sp. MPI-SDFR-AT-0126]|nr:hypothetical protein BKA64DRAFT_652010 [Leotiomycetes sp. MPI-SDFR-AT-0126]